MEYKIRTNFKIGKIIKTTKNKCDDFKKVNIIK